MTEFTQVVLLRTGLLQHHGWWAEVDEQAATITQRASSLLQDTEHLSVRERGPRTFHGKEFVSTTTVMRKVTAVTASERTELTLVGLLTRVRAHVRLKVALVR